MEMSEVYKRFQERKKDIENAKLKMARIQGAIDSAEKDIIALGTTVDQAPEYLRQLEVELTDINSELEVIANKLLIGGTKNGQ